MLTQTDFQGGVFHPDIEGGRAGARIEIGASELVARTIEGQVFRLPYNKVSLEEGGASGRMIFCRNPDRSLTIFCEERQFLPALAEFTGGMLMEQVEQIRRGRASARWGCLWGLFVSLFILAAMLVGGYIALSFAVAGMVNALPTDLDVQIGKASLTAMDSAGGEVKEATVEKPVQDILDRLKPHAPLQFPFSVHVIDNLETNAVAAPGGYIYVFRGMLDEAQTPEELAGVMAHEMAHVTQRHTLHRLGRSAGAVIGIQLLIGDVGGLVALAAELAHHTLMMTYSRDEELEADLVGADILYAADVDPLAVIKLAERLDKQIGNRRPPIWFADHPDFSDRIAAIRAHVATLPPKQYVPLAVDWAGMKKALAALGAAPNVAPPAVPANPAPEDGGGLAPAAKPANPEPIDEPKSTPAEAAPAAPLEKPTEP